MASQPLMNNPPAMIFYPRRMQAEIKRLTEQSMRLQRDVMVLREGREEERAYVTAALKRANTKRDEFINYLQNFMKGL